MLIPFSKERLIAKDGVNDSSNLKMFETPSLK